MNKHLNIFNILNILLILSCLTLGTCFVIYGGIIFKSLASACFVAVGLVNLICAIKNKSFNLKFCIVMLIGLVFAMLGDIVLYVHFIAGAVLFAIGHVFFFVAYCFLQKFKWIDLIIGASIAIISVLIVTLVPTFEFGGTVMELLCSIYAVIISFMVGKALSNLIRMPNILNLIILLGSALFFLSDLMLLIYVFGGNQIVFDIICLATYYPAECLLAYSLKQTIKIKESN